MAKRDYYDVLGVGREAGDDDLKKAYRRLAMKHHPDRNPDDPKAEQQFKEAKEAYEVLSDGEKRAAYNQFGHAGVEGNVGMGGGAGAAGFGDIFGVIFGDIFGAGGGGGRRGRSARGADLRYELELTLEDAVRGSDSRIQLPTLVRCDTCSGSGAKPGTSPSSCSTCGGQGQVRMQQGFFSIQQTCPQCSGRGSVITSPCGECSGQGRVQKSKTLQVKVPAGVDDGDQIRLAGEGEIGAAGIPAGDLYVLIRLKSHPIFSRDSDNLYCEMPVSFATATLGGNIDIPTLSGRANLKIPAESQSERVFRLRGKGVRNVRSGSVGDLYCKVKVETPVNLTRRQKEVLSEFEELTNGGGGRHSPRQNSWSGKLKSFFEDLES